IPPLQGTQCLAANVSDDIRVLAPSCNARTFRGAPRCNGRIHAQAVRQKFLRKPCYNFKWRCLMVRFSPLAFAIILLSNVFGQPFTSTIRFNTYPRALPAVTGAPYCADHLSERQQTLLDGTHIDDTHLVSHDCRDSAGRVRMERSAFAGGRPNPQADVKVI